MTDQAGSSAQRIRIGLTGLAIAFLLVLVSSIIIRSIDDNPVDSLRNDNAAAVREPEEPLAQLGVAPGAAPTENNISDDK